MSQNFQLALDACLFFSMVPIAFLVIPEWRLEILVYGIQMELLLVVNKKDRQINVTSLGTACWYTYEPLPLPWSYS